MPDDPSRIQFIADRGDARLRLDQVLVRRIMDVTRMSRSRAQQWIESGAVSVDDVRASRPSMRVREGATVAVVLPETVERRATPEPEDRPIDILYEDDHLLALNKAPGIVVHPSYKNVTGTLLNAVLWHVRDRRGVRPGIVSRLDKDTSGVLLISLTPGIHARLQRAPMRKEYLAVVAGTPDPPRGTVELPLGRHPDDRRRVVVTPDGLPSATIYEVLSSANRASMVRCELVTGRTHQIRVHMAARGWPLLGDLTYGVADPRLSRQALHAWRISFAHPVTGESLHLTAPIPNDLRELGSGTILSADDRC